MTNRVFLTTHEHFVEAFTPGHETKIWLACHEVAKERGDEIVLKIPGKPDATFQKRDDGTVWAGGVRYVMLDARGL